MLSESVYWITNAPPRPTQSNQSLANYHHHHPVSAVANRITPTSSQINP